MCRLTEPEPAAAWTLPPANFDEHSSVACHSGDIPEGSQRFQSGSAGIVRR